MAGIRGKRNRTWTPQIVRERMRAAALVRRLQKFALGETEDNGKCAVDMSPAQVTAALGLLKKCVPDLSAVELSGEVKTQQVRELSDAELANIIARGSEGAASETGGTKEPTELH